jgi:hypothetical protein
MGGVFAFFPFFLLFNYGLKYDSEIWVLTLPYLHSIFKDRQKVPVHKYGNF